MKERDKELDEILKPLRQISVPEDHMSRWKKSLKHRQNPAKRSHEMILVAAASLLIGFFIGKKTNPGQPQESNFVQHEQIDDSRSMSKNNSIRATKVETFINID